MNTKIILLIALGLATLFLISACGAGQEPVKAPEQPEPSPPTQAVPAPDSEDVEESVVVEDESEEVTEPEMEKQEETKKAAPKGNTKSAKEFDIVAKQWEFVPETIEVNQGDKVRLKITSVDVAHGYAINEYGINERLNPGQETVIEFTADKKGTFTTYCSVYCGSGHSRMKGTLIVK